MKGSIAENAGEVFSRHDVYVVAQALIEEAAEWSPTGPYQSQELRCRHCLVVNKQSDIFEDIKHDLDCPVLVAWDLLTKRGG